MQTVDWGKQHLKNFLSMSFAIESISKHSPSRLRLDDDRTCSRMRMVSVRSVHGSGTVPHGAGRWQPSDVSSTSTADDRPPPPPTRGPGNGAWNGYNTHTHTHTHTHTFNDPFSGTTRVSRYQKGKTNLDFFF